jgi:hypothetical protein
VAADTCDAKVDVSADRSHVSGVPDVVVVGVVVPVVVVVGGIVMPADQHPTKITPPIA